MAFVSIEQPARSRLAALRGVAIFDRPLPHEPHRIALVMAGLRCCEVVAEAGTFRAAAHLRFGEWLPLAEGVSEDLAFAAVLAFLSLLGPVPPHYAPEQDAAERAAAAGVLAAFSGASAKAAFAFPAAA